MTTLTMKEEKRLEIIQRVFRGELTVVEAGMVIGVSERQCYRIKARVTKRGAKGVVHGNRGRPCKHKTKEKDVKRVVELADHKAVVEANGSTLSAVHSQFDVRSPYVSLRTPRHPTPVNMSLSKPSTTVVPSTRAARAPLLYSAKRHARARTTLIRSTPSRVRTHIVKAAPAT